MNFLIVVSRRLILSSQPLQDKAKEISFRLKFFGGLTSLHVGQSVKRHRCTHTHPQKLSKKQSLTHHTHQKEKKKMQNFLLLVALH